MKLLVYLVVVAGHFIHISQGIQNRYLTQLCPGSVGPTHGEVVRFDPNYNNTQWVIPETDIDCYLTLRGMPSSSSVPWYVTLEWVGSFTVRGWDYADTGCDTAYIEIYYATIEGRPTGGPILDKWCGDTAPAITSTTNQAIVLHLYAEKEPETPSTTPGPVTPAPATVAGGAVTAATAAAVAVTTVASSGVTSSGGSSSSGNASLAPATGGPYIAFRADFTSYFIDCTSDGAENDEEQLQCNSNRCVDNSLVCDRFLSNNCGDFSDNFVGPPSNCSTVVEPEEETDDELLPLWIVLGILAALIMAYWCCWRPGYCPWRIARLRNCAGCRAMCKPCRNAACCRNGICGPAEGCYSRCAHGGCNRTKSGFPEKTPDNIDLNDANSGFHWLTFANDDGMHVREMR